MPILKDARTARANATPLCKAKFGSFSEKCCGAVEHWSVESAYESILHDRLQCRDGYSCTYSRARGGMMHTPLDGVSIAGALPYRAGALVGAEGPEHAGSAPYEPSLPPPRQCPLPIRLGPRHG